MSSSTLRLSTPSSTPTISSKLIQQVEQEESKKPRESKGTMTDVVESQQGVATGAGTAIVAHMQSVHPPQVLPLSFPSMFSSADCIDKVITPDKEAARGGIFPPSPPTVPLQPQQQYQPQPQYPPHQNHHHHQQQQYHSIWQNTPLLPVNYQYQQGYHGQHTSHADEHEHYHRNLPQGHNSHQYSMQVGHHQLFPSSTSSLHEQFPLNTSPQFAYTQPNLALNDHARIGPYSASYVPPYRSYQAARYPRSIPSPSMRDHYSEHQIATAPILNGRRSSMVHSHHMSNHSSPAFAQHPSTTPSSPLSLPMSVDSSAKVRASTIYAPGANVSGTATNYGRLPDGKIIELYPAMMRTIQACEYCRNRKAKCSGGQPCERCSKKGEKCEYAEIDSKKRIRTLTSEPAMSSKDSKRRITVKSDHPAKERAAQSRGSGTGRSPTKPYSSTIPAAESKSIRRSERLRSSAKPDYVEETAAAASLLAVPIVEDVPLDLCSSPFTPAAQISQYRHKEHNGPIRPSLTQFALPQFATVIQPFQQSSPASTASCTLSEMYVSGPAPEALFSPTPMHSTCYEDARDSWVQNEVAAPSAPQISAFRRGPSSHHLTNFF